MIYPKFIKQGDTIGVPAPSDGAYCEEYVTRYKNAKLNLEKRGYEVLLSKNIFHSEKGRSSDAISRAEEMNGMFENDTDAIICAAGGEFLVEILPYINFEKAVQNPKWVQGFSDPTGLLFPLTTKYDIATIYSNNFKSFGAEEYHKSLEENLEILSGNIITQNSYDLFENERAERITGLEGYNLTDKVYWKTIDNKEVTIQGRIIATKGKSPLALASIFIKKRRRRCCYKKRSNVSFGDPSKIRTGKKLRLLRIYITGTARRLSATRLLCGLSKAESVGDRFIVRQEAKHSKENSTNKREAHKS